MQKQEILLLLGAVEEQLCEGDGSLARENLMQKKKPMNGIRINGQLSFRGTDKARELFRLLDSDNDGFMSFEDFRGAA